MSGTERKSIDCGSSPSSSSSSVSSFGAKATSLFPLDEPLLDNLSANETPPKDAETASRTSPQLPIDQDELNMFVSETELSSFHFLDLWGHVLQELHWTYVSGRYQAPPDPQHGVVSSKGEVFENAKHLVAFLDGQEWALKLYENTYVGVPEDQRREFVTRRAKALRNEILKAYFPTVKQIEQDAERIQRDQVERKLHKQQQAQQDALQRVYGFGEPDTICDVCFDLERNTGQRDFSPFVQCKSCKLLVHFDCYLPQIEEEDQLGKGHAVDKVGLDEDGFFVCDVCRANGGRNIHEIARVRNMPKALPDDVEAKGDGRVHTGAFCQLCLRNDVCGGLKQTNDGDAEIWVHQACIQCIPEAFNRESKIHFQVGKKEAVVSDIVTQNETHIEEVLMVSVHSDSSGPLNFKARILFHLKMSSLFCTSQL